MTLIARVLGVVGNDIQVSGRTCFDGNRWRDAILYYLNGVWGNRRDVVYRPKISFGDITLRLDTSSGEYYAYGHAEVPQEPPPCKFDETLYVRSARQADVEVGLIRFVKNDRIKELRLSVVTAPNVRRTQLVLWKGTKRGEYGYAGIGLPYTWGTRGPVWTREEFQRGL